MMRRTIDGVIPLAATIAAWPTALGLIPMPPSVVAYIGAPVAQLWMATLAVSFTSVVAGVVVSKRHPNAAFGLEAVPYSYVGALFFIHVIALATANGISAWANCWWELGLVAYFYSRCVELWIALHKARRKESPR